MMRSKRSSKNSIRTGLLCSLVASLLLIGCETDIAPSFKENDIPYLVKNICKDEYGLDVTTYRTNTTLWIYVPMSNIMHKKYGVEEDKIFADDMLEKVRNILTSIGRVLISADRTPDFYVMVTSDITTGLDYAIFGNVMDIKKSYAGAIPWTEANKRYVIDFRLNAKAIKDRSGIHLETYDITLPDFLAKLIAQRIAHLFQEENNRAFYKVEKSDGQYQEGIFTFDYKIVSLKGAEQLPPISKAIHETVAYCLKTYEFSDFTKVLITDLEAQRTEELSKADIRATPIN